MLNQFIKSIYSYKVIANSRFQPVTKTIKYMFFLSLFSLLPSIISLASGTLIDSTDLSNEASDAFIIVTLLSLIGIYFFFSLSLFAFVSFNSWLASFLQLIFRKKLPYKQLWNITAFSFTLPTILFILLEIFLHNVNQVTLWSYALNIIITLFVIWKLPNKKK